VRAVERAIDVLDVIKTRAEGAGVSEISRELGLARSTVHRLLVALQKKEMVYQRADSDRYTIGRKALELAFFAVPHLDIVYMAMPHLEELRNRLDETAALALKVRLCYTYVSQVPSLKEYRVTPSLGQQYPLHWAAAGKAILAYVREEELNECLKVVPHLSATPKTITDPDVLLEQLEQIRRTGFAISFGERNIGAAGIAAPIRNRQGYAHAAIALVGPESRLRQVDLEAFGRVVVEIARNFEALCQLFGLGD
jgi:DNA-binding IclR family transcriptional regulator